MHARATCLAFLLAAIPAHAQMAAETSVRAELAPNGDAVRLVAVSGGKAPNLTLTVGKGKPEKLYKGETVGTVKSGHGKVVAAYAAYDGKAPFRVHVVGGKDASFPRPSKRIDVPYAVAMTTTPDGFTVLFQEVEAQNPNEAHTYMALLDADGTPSGELREVQIPWALGDMAWNGKGYHLALYYSGGDGVRLSMVSTDAKGSPQGHPDWSSKPGLVSDVHLVADGDKILAFYRGGMGDRLLESDVTKIRQWGSDPPKAKDHGELGATQAIAITAKGAPTKVSQR